MNYETKNGFIIIRRLESERSVDGFKLAEDMEDGGVIFHGSVVAGNESYPAGTHILFSRYMPTDFSDGKETLLVLKQDDVVAVVHNFVQGSVV